MEHNRATEIANNKTIKFGCKCFRKIITAKRKGEATVRLHLPVQSNVRFQTAELFEHPRYISSSGLPTPDTLHSIIPPFSENSTCSINSEMPWLIAGSHNKVNQRESLESTSSRYFDEECSHLYGPNPLERIKMQPATRKRKRKSREVMRIRRASNLYQSCTQSTHPLHRARETTNFHPTSSSTLSSCQKQTASIPRVLPPLSELLPSEVSLARSWRNPSLSTSKQTLSFTYLSEPNKLVRSVGTQTFSQSVAIGRTTTPKLSYCDALLGGGNYQFSKGRQSTSVQSIAPSPSKLFTQDIYTEWSGSSSSVSIEDQIFQQNNNWNIRTSTQTQQSTGVALSESSRQQCPLGQLNSASESSVPLTNKPATHNNLGRLWAHSSVPTDNQGFTLHYTAEPNETIQYMTHLPKSEMHEIVTETYPGKTNLAVEITMKSENHNGDTFSERIRPQCILSQQQPIPVESVHPLLSTQSKLTQDTNSERLLSKTSLSSSNDQIILFHYVAEPQETVRYLRYIPNSEVHEIVSETFEKKTNLTIEITKRPEHHNSNSLPEERRHTVSPPRRQPPSHERTSPPCVLSTLDTSTDRLLSNLPPRTDDHPSVRNYVAKPEMLQHIREALHHVVGGKVASEFPKGTDVTFGNTTVNQNKGVDLSQRERQHLTFNQHQHTLEEDLLPARTEVYTERSPPNSLLSSDEQSCSANSLTQPQKMVQRTRNVAQRENRESSTHSFKKESLLAFGVFTKPEEKFMDASLERSRLQYRFRKQQYASIESILPLTNKPSTLDINMRRLYQHSASVNVRSAQDITVSRSRSHSAIDNVIPLALTVSAQDITVKRSRSHSAIDDVVPLTQTVSAQDITLKRLSQTYSISTVNQPLSLHYLQNFPHNELYKAVTEKYPTRTNLSTRIIKKQEQHQVPMVGQQPASHQRVVPPTREHSRKGSTSHTSVVADDEPFTLNYVAEPQETIRYIRNSSPSKLREIVTQTFQDTANYTIEITNLSEQSLGDSLTENNTHEVPLVGHKPASDQRVEPPSTESSTVGITNDSSTSNTSVVTDDEPFTLYYVAEPQETIRYVNNSSHNKVREIVTQTFQNQANLTIEITNKSEQSLGDPLTENNTHEVPLVEHKPASDQTVEPPSTESSTVGITNDSSTSNTSVVTDDEPFTLHYVAEPQETIRYVNNSSHNKVREIVTQTFQNQANLTIEITNKSEQSLGDPLTENNAHEVPLVGHKPASDQTVEPLSTESSTVGITNDSSTSNTSVVTDDEPFTLYYVAEPQETIRYVNNSSHNKVREIVTQTLQNQANLIIEITNKSEQSLDDLLSDKNTHQISSFEPASDHQKVVSPASEHENTTLVRTNESSTANLSTMIHEELYFVADPNTVRCVQSGPYNDVCEVKTCTYQDKSNLTNEITRKPNQGDCEVLADTRRQQSPSHPSIAQPPSEDSNNTHGQLLISHYFAEPNETVRYVQSVSHSNVREVKTLTFQNKINLMIEITTEPKQSDGEALPDTRRQQTPSYQRVASQASKHTIQDHNTSNVMSNPSLPTEEHPCLRHSMAKSRETKQSITKVAYDERVDNPRHMFPKESNLNIIINTKQSEDGVFSERGSGQYHFGQQHASIENVVSLTHKASTLDITMERSSPDSSIEDMVSSTDKASTQDITMERSSLDSSIEDMVSLTHKASTLDITMERSSPDSSIEDMVSSTHKASTLDITMERSSPDSSIEDVSLTHKASTLDITMARSSPDSSIEDVSLTHKASTLDITMERSSPDSSIEDVSLTHKASTLDITMERSSPDSSIEDVSLTHKASTLDITMERSSPDSSIEDVSLTHKASTLDITMERSSPDSSIEDVSLTHKASTLDITMERSSPDSSIEDVSLTHKASTLDITMERSSPDSSIEDVSLTHKASTQDITMERSSPDSSIEDMVSLTHKASTLDITMERSSPDSSIEDMVSLTHKASTQDITMERSSPDSSIEDMVSLTHKASTQDITMEVINTPEQNDIDALPKRSQHHVKKKITINTVQREDDTSTSSQQEPASYQSLTMLGNPWSTCDNRTEKSMSVPSNTTDVQSFTTDCIAEPSENVRCARSSLHRNVREVIAQTFQDQTNLTFGITNIPEQNDSDLLPDGSKHQLPLIGQQTVSRQRIVAPPNEQSMLGSSNESSTSNSTVLANEQSFPLCYVAEPKEAVQDINIPNNEMLEEDTNLSRSITTHSDESDNDAPLRDRYQIPLVGQQPALDEGIVLVSSASETSAVSAGTDSLTSISSVPTDEEPFTFHYLAEPEETIPCTSSCSQWDLSEIVIDECQEASYFSTETNLSSLDTSSESSMSIPSVPTDEPPFSLQCLAEHQDGDQCVPLENNITIETIQKVEQSEGVSFSKGERHQYSFSQQEHALDLSISPPPSEISTHDTSTESSQLNSAFLSDLTIQKTTKPERSDSDVLPEVGKHRLPLSRHSQKSIRSFAQPLLPADRRVHSRRHITKPDETGGCIRRAPHSEVVAQTPPGSSPSLPTGYQFCSLSYEAERLPCVLDVPHEHDGHEMVTQSFSMESISIIRPLGRPDQCEPQLPSIDSAELPPNEQPTINTIISRPFSMNRLICDETGMLLMFLTEESQIKLFEPWMHINPELDAMPESGRTETRLLTPVESGGTSSHSVAWLEATNTQQTIKSIADDNISHHYMQNAIRHWLYLSSVTHRSCHNISPCSLQTPLEPLTSQFDSTGIYCQTYSSSIVTVLHESRNSLLEGDTQQESTQYKYNKPLAVQCARVSIYQVQRRPYVSIHRHAASSLHTSYDSEEKGKPTVHSHDFPHLLSQQESIFDTTNDGKDVQDRNLPPTHKITSCKQEIESISYEVPISCFRPNVHNIEADTAYQHLHSGMEGSTYAEHKLTDLKHDSENASVPETCYLGENKRSNVKITTDINDIRSTSSTHQTLPKPNVNQYLLDRNEHSTSQSPITISDQSKLCNQTIVGQSVSRQVLRPETTPERNHVHIQSTENVSKLKPTARPARAKKDISNKSKRSTASTLKQTNVLTCPKDNPQCIQSTETLTENTTKDLPPSPTHSERLLTHESRETKVDSSITPIVDVNETKKWSDPEGNCTWYTQSTEHIKRSKARGGTSIGRPISNKRQALDETKAALKIPTFASKTAVDWSDPFDNCTWYTQSTGSRSQKKGKTEFNKLATQALNKTNIEFGTVQTATPALRTTHNKTEKTSSNGSHIVNCGSDSLAAQAIPAKLCTANEPVGLVRNLKAVNVKHENEEQSLARNGGRVKLASTSEFSSITRPMTTYVSQPIEYHGTSKLPANQDKMDLIQDKHKEGTQEKSSSSAVTTANQAGSDFHQVNSDGFNSTANYYENLQGCNLSGVYRPKMLAKKREMHCDKATRSSLQTVVDTHPDKISNITNVLPSKQEYNTQDSSIKQDKDKPEGPSPGNSRRSHAINWDIFGATSSFLEDLWLGRSFLEVYNPQLLGSEIEKDRIDAARRGVRILQQVLNTSDDDEEDESKHSKTKP